MSLPDETKMEQVRAFFEDKEAIYVEKGVLRVKVTHIHGDVAQQFMSADVEEIPTAGFPAGPIHKLRMSEPRPMRWNIEGGYLTTFSEHTWQMGYGGWSLFFAPRIVEGVVSLALQFSDNIDSFHRYREVLNYLTECDAYEPTHRVFAEP
jgi:hypothetical protein